MTFDPCTTPAQTGQPATIGDMLALKTQRQQTLDAMEAEYLETIRPFREAYEHNRAPIQAEVTDLDTRIVARARDLSLKARELTGKPDGTVNFVDGGAHVKAVARKRVIWDQDRLLDVFHRILTAGDDPFLYMKARWSVGERAYKAAAPEVRAVFDPARTVELTETFSIEATEA